MSSHDTDPAAAPWGSLRTLWAGALEAWPTARRWARTPVGRTADGSRAAAPAESDLPAVVRAASWAGWAVALPLFLWNVALVIAYRAGPFEGDGPIATRLVLRGIAYPLVSVWLLPCLLFVQSEASRATASWISGRDEDSAASYRAFCAVWPRALLAVLAFAYVVTAIQSWWIFSVGTDAEAIARIQSGEPMFRFAVLLSVWFVAIGGSYQALRRGLGISRGASALGALAGPAATFAVALIVTVVLLFVGMFVSVVLELFTRSVSPPVPAPTPEDYPSS